MSQKRRIPADEPHFLVRTLAADFPDGRRLPAHAHPWGQLIFAVAGVLSVWTEQGSWVVPPHRAVWAPAGMAHGMHFTGRTSLRTLYLRPAHWRELPERCVVIGVSPLLRELILRAVELGMLDDRRPAHVGIADLVVHELRARPTPALDLPLPRSARLRRIAEHLAEAPGDRSGHTTLAGRFGIGTRTLERGFVAETGLSLGRWRRQARLLHALRRLGSGAQVKRVAREAGYRSPSAFVAAFRAALGTTPARYFGER